jgi:hypothetical protein
LGQGIGGNFRDGVDSKGWAQECALSSVKAGAT